MMYSASARRLQVASNNARRLLRQAPKRRSIVTSSSSWRLAAPKRSYPRNTSIIVRQSSTTATSASASASDASTAAKARDFFLDHLGKVFLGLIAAVILSLVRSSYGTSNQKKVVEQLEESSALDPLEIDELRKANTELTPELFRMIAKEVLDDAEDGSMTYERFVVRARSIMRREKGNHCTIGLGYLLDRVVIAALKNGNLIAATKDKEAEPSFGGADDATAFTQDLAMPVAFWLTVLSLALNGPVPDRIRILYELMEQQPSNNNGLDGDQKKVTLQDVTTMVRFLQETCQLVPEKQVVMTDVKYPTQQFRRGLPEELVQWEKAAEEAQGSMNIDPKEEVLDIDAFADILRSKSVCAWGECYFKKKFVA